MGAGRRNTWPLDLFFYSLWSEVKLSSFPLVPSFVQGLGGNGAGAFPAGKDRCGVHLHLDVGGEAAGHRPWEAPGGAAVWG